MNQFMMFCFGIVSVCTWLALYAQLYNWVKFSLIVFGGWGGTFLGISKGYFMIYFLGCDQDNRQDAAGQI